MRLILLDGDMTVAEFGYLRLDPPPPRAVNFEGEIYVLSHPMVAFGEGTRQVVGWYYRLELPLLKLRPEDRLGQPLPLHGGVG